MKFTKEEIILCKQVAERHRREIKFGDWYLNQADEKDFPQLCKFVQNTNVLQSVNEYIIPLWTISDCLEFLKSKIFYGSLSDVGTHYEASYTKTIISEDDEKHLIQVRSGIVKTPLEACLKAVLAVLEESK